MYSMHYLALFCAIIAEVIATSALQASQQFTKPGPSAVVVVGYGLSFFCMALALKVMPLGIVYAVWSGMGLVCISAIAWIVFGQKLDLPAILGIGMILMGVLVIHLFSNTTTH
jgi:small multidrug resistance pump